MVKVSDEDLIKQVLSGKRKAFETLVERYQRTVFNVAFRSTRDYDDSQDITQAVFIKAFENLSTFNSNYRFFSWLYRIAVNESINYVNQRKQLKPLDDEMIAENAGPDEKYGEEELTEQIQSALMEIDMNYRIAIILKHFQSCSYKEMSYILDIPEKTVKSRLYSARQMLRDVLQKKGAIYYD